MKVPFGDLRRQYDQYRDAIDSAIRRVLDRGWFVLGDEVSEFEREFAAYIGARNAVGVASGTEAIQLALTAAGVGQNDEVITAPNTCVPTVAAITAAGATPVFADIDELSFNLDPDKVERAITSKTRAILPVHLYGQAADMDPLLEIARARDIAVIEDAAQAHGTVYRGRKVGTFGDAACFSFYPSKNLGAYGDGGAVVTDDDAYADRVRLLRNYGQERRYFHSLKGINSRLDELQAAILRTKLSELDRWNDRRREIALRYTTGIHNPQVRMPVEREYGRSNFHLFVVRSSRRDSLQEHLRVKEVETLIHYPIPVHLQEAYKDLNYHAGDFPAAERCANEVLSLPLFPEMTEREVEKVISAVNSFTERC
ncbi:MAG TPA: DegT/DnrJ/EryC1/StrS family aminotransferase [Blastocatellia bacterium]|nr:DegT/DnrJ/EryC1/StrS family aminotransferase [Blastocatellia bacterium]